MIFQTGVFYRLRGGVWLTRDGNMLEVPDGSYVLINRLGGATEIHQCTVYAAVLGSDVKFERYCWVNLHSHLLERILPEVEMQAVIQAKIRAFEKSRESLLASALRQLTIIGTRLKTK